jgi:hypothetical protein
VRRLFTGFVMAAFATHQQLDAITIMMVNEGMICHR